MPKSNVTVNATFKKIKRSIITTSENGSVITNQANNSLVEVGENVELTLTPNQWCELESLTVTDSHGNNIPVNNNTFVMPADNVTVNAKFKEINLLHNIIIEETENGSVVTDVGPENVRVETPVNMTITPNYGYELDTLVVTDEEGNNIPVTNNSFSMPITNAKITSTFKHIKKSATLNNPEGGSVTTNQADNTKINVGDTVKLNLTPDENYELDELIVKDEAGNDIPVTDNSFLMPNSNVTINASYRHITKAITIGKSDNGTTKVNIENPKNVNAGEEVKIIAEPNDEYEVQEIIVTDEEGNKIEVSSNGTFIMPAKNVIITTIFKTDKINNNEPENSNNDQEQNKPDQEESGNNQEQNKDDQEQSENDQEKSESGQEKDKDKQKENKDDQEQSKDGQGSAEGNSEETKSENNKDANQTKESKINNNTKNNDNTPKTGDKIVLIVTVLIFSMTMFFMLGKKKHKK